MKYDCGFVKGNNWFRYRTGGILIHNNKMLFVKSGIGDYILYDWWWSTFGRNFRDVY